MSRKFAVIGQDDLRKKIEEAFSVEHQGDLCFQDHLVKKKLEGDLKVEFD